MAIYAYAYDTLHRLTTVDYNTGGVTGDEVYVYDSLGNRVTYTDQRNSITRAYANNKANEYTSVATFGVTHDPAGNLARQVVDGSGNAYVYNYDCDNRLLKVEYDPLSSTINTALATFAYDALGRRITAWTQFDINAPGGDNQTKDLRFYHDGQVEIADYDANGALSRRFINGTQYIDERAVLVEGTAAAADTFYYLLQELYTVTGLIEKNGALAEANVYDGYGKVTIWDYSPGDFDRDGDVDATDQISFNAAKPVGGTGSGVPAKDPMADLDMDGDVDNTDSTAFTTIKNAGGAVKEAFVSSIGNPFFFTGRRLYFLETLPEVSSTAIANQQLQHNRARDYIPELGRWGQRDPAEYVDRVNLYEYVLSRTLSSCDPLGLRAITFQFNAFIGSHLNPPGKGPWFPQPGFPLEPPYEFSGDNRVHGQHGTSRLSISGFLNSNELGRFSLFSGWGVTASTGFSHRRPVGSNKVETAHASARASADFANIGVCSSEIFAIAAASYPFHENLAPDIDMWIDITATAIEKRRVAVDWVVHHNAFPDYELLIDGKLVYTYTTSSAGPGFNLVGGVYGPGSYGSLIIHSDTPLWCCNLPKPTSCPAPPCVISGQ